MQTKPVKSKFPFVAVGVGILTAALVVISIVGITKFGTIFFLFPIWRWMAHKMTDATGMDIWLTRGISALLVIPFVYIIKMVFSWDKSRRHNGIVLAAVATAVVCFGIFHISKDIYFSFETGEAKKYYIITPQEEYVFNSSPGHDTTWGKKYEEVTPKVIEDYMERIRERDNGDDKWVGIVLLVATAGLVIFSTIGFLTSSSTSVPKSAMQRSKLKPPPTLTEEEEMILLQSLNKPLMTEEDGNGVLDAIRMLLTSSRDYSEEICNFLKRDVYEHLQNRTLPLYSRKFTHAPKAIVWSKYKTQEVIRLLAGRAFEKAVPTLVEILGNALDKDVRDAARRAISKIRNKKG